MSYRRAVMAAKYAGGPMEQATTLHEERLEAVTAGEGCFAFDAPHAVVAHLVPKGVYDDGYAVDLSETGVLPEAAPRRATQLPVLGAEAAHGTWTADGFGARAAPDGGPAWRTGYAHLFSNGVVETVSALPFVPRDEGAPTVDGRALELGLTACARRYLRVLAFHGLPTPMHVVLGVYGAEGARLDPGEDGDDPAEFRDDVVAPFPAAVDGFDVPDLRAELAGPIGAIWRAAGRPGSPFFERGDWTLRSAFEEAE